MAKSSHEKALDSKKEKVVRMTKAEARKSMGSGFLPKESAEQQRLNRIGRAGTKRPEHGDWPQFKKAK